MNLSQNALMTTQILLVPHQQLVSMIRHYYYYQFMSFSSSTTLQKLKELKNLKEKQQKEILYLWGKKKIFQYVHKFVMVVTFMFVMVILHEWCSIIHDFIMEVDEIAYTVSKKEYLSVANLLLLAAIKPYIAYKSEKLENQALFKYLQFKEKWVRSK